MAYNPAATHPDIKGGRMEKIPARSRPAEEKKKSQSAFI